MSEVQKPVEVAPVAAEPAPVVVEPAVTETPAPVVAPVTEAPKDAAQPEEATKEEPKAEVTPATDGVLGHKAPGLVKSLRFSKRYFWFSEEPVEVDHLTHFFQNEKLSVAHPLAAWASQTGKGLLFIAKRAEDKSHPTGIINLAEVSDVIKEGANEFSFKWNSHKHGFQASSAAERDSWLAALEAKCAAAKLEKDNIVGSEGYKTELEKLTKPAVGVAAVSSSPKKSMEAKAKDMVKKVEGEETKSKSRSQSRKRASIFGTILGKRDEEVKKEETKPEDKPEGEEAKKSEPEAPAEEPVAPVAAVAAPATTEPEVPAAATEAPAAPATETKTEEAKRPEPKKRNSMFGTLLQKVTNQHKTEKEAPAKPAETTTPVVSSTAPQLADPVNPAEPIEPETVAQPEATTEAPKETPEEPVTSPSSAKGFFNFMKKEKHEDKEAKPEEKADKTPEEAPATEEPVTTPEAIGAALKEKRRTSFFGNFGTRKEKKAEPTDGEIVEGEQPKVRSPSIPRLGGLFRKPSRAVKKEKEPAAAPAEADAPATETTTKPEETPAVPAINGTEEEIKPAPATAPVVQPVQTAA